MKSTKILATAVAVALGSLALISYTNAEVTVTPWSAPDYIDTEWNIFEMGSLTITDWTNTITILDRNLWATQTWTSCSAYNNWACGYFFQRWNNYWFGNPLNKTETTRVDTTIYSRVNPYVGDTFIQWNSNRSSINNTNLRWWAWDTKSSRPNPDYMRQWPCPQWYHVPTYGELDTLKMLAWNNWKFVNTGFFIPFAGNRGMNTSLYYLGGDAYLWSSSPNGSTTRYLGLNSNGNANMNGHPRVNAYSLRCFKDTDTTISVLSFNTRGWQRMQWQTVPIWGTGHTPWYEPKKVGDEFMGWYKDEICSQPFDFQTELITENTTIYAKWANDPSLAQINLSIQKWTLTIWTEIWNLNLWEVNVSNNTQELSWSFGTNSFWVEDMKWIESWYYTTISVTDLIWSVAGHVISADNVLLKTAWNEPNYISWALVNESKVVFWNGIKVWHSGSWQVNYFQRLNTSSSEAWRLWKWWDNLQVKVNIPAHTPSDTYRWTITYTLYDLDS